ncbi:fumarylacetoacetate hydrolase family protein [Parasphingopyxis sp.]|uniref:fumarylacetoacetate hydrolase family protein n=1 Tax=Parasphingopyxis sp. TaxID=1920299 RepID=UPI002616B0A5|nr:fumarylacetoacetate hydrolase family protein [Parasphingopyxis sp.]
MGDLFELAPNPRVEICDSSDVFPVRRIYCVGRNYAAHAAEMGADERDPPFFFTKFPDTLLTGKEKVLYPPRTSNYHYEGELVLAIGKDLKNGTLEDASDVIFGYAGGLDMTRRDLQLAARDKGRPWDMGKNFDQAAILTPIRRAGEVDGGLAGRSLTLAVNGEIKQQTDLDLLIWSCEEIVAELSAYVTLQPGDLIFTGTPAGVGPVVTGDTIKLTIDGLPDLTVEVG